MNKEQNEEIEKIEIIDEPESSGMDIFSKGFVKPTMEQIVENKKIEEPIEKIEEEKNETIEIVQEKQEDNEKINDNKHKKKRKKLIFIIGIIIELLVIGFLIWFTFFRKNYTTVVDCTDTVKNKIGKYYITTNNVYYFDSSNEVVKTENIISYSFENKDSYDKFKKDYVESDITNVSGIKQESNFNDTNLKYETKTIYDYRTLKRNKKNVKIKDNLMTITIEGRQNPITIYIQNMEEVALENNEKGFICKEK